MSIPILIATLILFALCIVYKAFDYRQKRKEALEAYLMSIEIIEMKKAEFLRECEQPLLIFPREKKLEYGE